jgi:hypothetical protein
MSIAISRRARRALLAAAVPAALAATALPASADAATARLVGVGPTAVPQLQYTAAAGESNDVRVVFTGTHNPHPGQRADHRRHRLRARTRR